MRSGLPVAHGLGAVSIAGQGLVCDNPVGVTRHLAKVYGHLHQTLVPSTAATSTAANSTSHVRKLRLPGRPA